MRRRKLPGNKGLDFVFEKQSTRHLTHPKLTWIFLYQDLQDMEDH